MNNSDIWKISNMKSSMKIKKENDIINIKEVFYDDGTWYVGEMKGSLRHGRGKLMISEGDFYEGDFRDNKIEGFGLFRGRDGTTY